MAGVRNRFNASVEVIRLVVLMYARHISLRNTSQERQLSKARDLVRMNADEVAAFLGSAHTLQVATLDAEGAPHLTALWFLYYEGDILFETYGKSQKVMNLRRDPRIAVQAEDGKTYGELRGVSIKGRAEIVENEPELTQLMTMLLRHHFPTPGDAEIAKMAKSMAAKRVVVRVRPEKLMSWDHRKLGTDARP